MLCPHVVTGGPEAIHQASDTILGLGGEVVVAYYGSQVGLSIDDGVVHCVYNGRPTPPAYRDYRALIAARIPLTEQSLVIYPESVLDWALQPRPFQRAIWWLSVDNAIVKAPQLAYDNHRRKILERDDLLHFYQSDYARDYLVKGGARRCLPLADYINRDFASGGIDLPREKSISYFPRKGGAMASAFFERHGDLLPRPIENMPREAVRDTLRGSSLYIDFGHHPGKDRIPREAALSGNVIFLHERGAANFYVDHPLDPFYLFTGLDIANGSLHKRVTWALQNREHALDQQALYRARIAHERDEFEWQVKSWFFEPVSQPIMSG